MEAQRHGSFPLSRLDGEDNGIPPELGGHPILSRKTLPEQVDDHSHHAIVLAVARPLSGLRLLDQARVLPQDGLNRDLFA
jgi:hypothetical protein